MGVLKKKVAFMTAPASDENVWDSDSLVPNLKGRKMTGLALILLVAIRRFSAGLS